MVVASTVNTKTDVNTTMIPESQVVLPGIAAGSATVNASGTLRSQIA
jgi:hypothetical protein